MSGLIGKKLGMTSIFDANGNNIPCTLVEAGPCVVTHIKTKDKEGYNAVQLSFGEKSEKRANKAETGHFAKSGTTPKKKVVEFRAFDREVKLGESVNVEIFSEGEYVDISGTSKGKGFQGVVKRHGFAGVGMASHGQHNRLRAPGSIGAASFPARVFKGMKMAGRMGGKRTTVQNLKVLKIIPEKNLLLLSGAVPGANNSYITIYN